MAVVRGIVVVIACGVLSAIGGGVIASALNWLAPSYYPGVFPHAGEVNSAAEVGVGAGIIQGAWLGLFVGAALAGGLAWFGQLQWAACARGLAMVAACTALFAIGGGLVGLGLGLLIPGYYQAVVSGGEQADSNPADVGIGLGASQGAILGVIIGGLIVITCSWRQARFARPSTPNDRDESSCGFCASLGSGVGLCVGILWTMVFGPLTAGPPSMCLSFLVYTTSFTFTGFVVGTMQRLPLLVGAVTGFLTLLMWALIVGPKDGWMALWVIMFGGSGLFCGILIGCLFWITRRLASGPNGPARR
ncbi:MAG: hypothetical protein ACQESR_24460 [Planctomycetota bacterium]